MGKYFSDVVDKALEDLYYCYDNDRARASADALLEAAKNGDGEACYLLSRCFSGTCYSWDHHPFTENREAASAMLRLAISQGSAMAVLGAIRMDMLTPEFKELMPFATAREAWETVYEKAQAGCLFCQYMIGNTYYYLDLIEIDDRKESEFAGKKEWDNWRIDQMKQSLPWFESAFEGGVGLAGRNLYNYYNFGRGDLIAPEPEKAMEVARHGAELGYAEWMCKYGVKLYDRKQKKEGAEWGRKAAEAGHLSGWSIVGDAYLDAVWGEKDCKKALECYEKAAADGKDSYACYQAGKLYMHGSGAPRDYAKAVQYLERHYAITQGEYKDTEWLGICYLLGYGCKQNSAWGKALLEWSNDCAAKRYGLGMMYAEGIGVPEDIEKGVEYLKSAQSYEPAQKALQNYKKSLFGVWRRKNPF